MDEYTDQGSDPPQSAPKIADQFANLDLLQFLRDDYGSSRSASIRPVAISSCEALFLSLSHSFPRHISIAFSLPLCGRRISLWSPSLWSPYLNRVLSLCGRAYPQSITVNPPLRAAAQSRISRIRNLPSINLKASEVSTPIRHKTQGREAAVVYSSYSSAHKRFCILQESLRSDPTAGKASRVISLSHSRAILSPQSLRVLRHQSPPLVLAVSRRRETLNLSKNSIGDEGVKCLCDILVNNSGIERLQLNSSAFGDEGAKAIAEMLKKNSSLRVLELNNNLIDYSGFSGLAGALLENISMQSIHPSKSPVTPHLYIDDQPEFDPDSWINVVNGPSKGRIYGFGPRQHVSHVLGIPTSPRRSILVHDFMSNEDVNKLKSKLASARNMIEENNERIDNLTVRLERVERNHKVELRETVRNMLRELNIANNQFPSSSGSRNNDI
ncbi:Chloroplast envelope protein 1 [Abeliophyllum distichum]|uniref:Chloroplast envelope protein 1 n=1 Tax=Abeliophyllum distichum TaxID=126358 RepID=A0ABD1T0P4_9LAMI